MQMSNMGQTRNVHDKVPADNAPEQHGSDQECKVPADNSKNVTMSLTMPTQTPLQSLPVLLKPCSVPLATVPRPLF